MHPDKNRDDPDSDEKFMKISNIYEVLKDEDSRKRYDLFGEAGLTPKSPGSKRNYEDVMKGFTAYDDCEDCFGLDESDFDSAVQSSKLSGKVWFIVFKSKGCHACNDMADAFSSAAKELSGIVSFGYVECNRYNRRLCQAEKITKFPTIKVGHVIFQYLDIEICNSFIMEVTNQYYTEMIDHENHSFVSLKNSFMLRSLKSGMVTLKLKSRIQIVSNYLGLWCMITKKKKSPHIIHCSDSVKIVLNYKPSVKEPITIVSIAIIKPLIANNVLRRTILFIF